MRKQPIYLFLVFFSVIIQSSSCKHGFDNSEDFARIFMNTQNGENILPLTSWVASNDSSILVFGLAGSALSSKFDASDKLYACNISFSGHLLFDTIFNVPSGFPADILQYPANPDKFIVLWNQDQNSQAMFEIKANPNEFTLSSSSGFPINLTNDSSQTTFGFMTGASISKVGDFKIIGFEEDSFISPAKLVSTIKQVTSLGQGIQTQTVRQYPYVPEEFGGLGLSSLSVLRKLDKYLFLENDKNDPLNYWYYIPVNSSMALYNYNNPVAVYSDSSYWLVSMKETSLGLSGLFSPHDVLGSGMYFVPSITIEAQKQTFADLSSLTDVLDLSNEYNTAIHETEQGILILGTNYFGQLCIYTLLNDQLTKALVIGEQYPYELTSVISHNDGFIYLIGHTPVDFKYERIFMFKIAISYIFNQPGL